LAAGAPLDGDGAIGVLDVVLVASSWQ